MVVVAAQMAATAAESELAMAKADPYSAKRMVLESSLLAMHKMDSQS